LILLAAKTVAAGDVQYVVVDDPYIEFHTGAGEGYPVTHVVERGEQIGILKRRTDWFLIRGPKGKEGWVSKGQLERTMQLSGQPVVFPEPTLADYKRHKWELGGLIGEFGGATVYTGYGSYRFSNHLDLEIDISQVLGNFSDGWIAAVNLNHTFRPDWRASPFFTLGTGIINIEPKAALAQAEDRTDQVAIVGLGVKSYLSRRFLLRLEYKGYIVLTSRNDNEDVDEWKAGFAVFF